MRRSVWVKGFSLPSAATGLASWLADTHRQHQGYMMLQPIYDSFTEGLATPDLKAARMLLNALM